MTTVYENGTGQKQQAPQQDQPIYACVDNLSFLVNPFPSYQLSQDIFLGVGVADNPGAYRQVDPQFIGWMEWSIHTARQRGVSGDEITKAEEFIKQLKLLTGFEGIGVDVSYQKPYREHAWLDDAFPPEGRPVK